MGNTSSRASRCRNAKKYRDDCSGAQRKVRIDDFAIKTNESNTSIGPKEYLENVDSLANYQHNNGFTVPPGTSSDSFYSNLQHDRKRCFSESNVMTESAIARDGGRIEDAQNFHRTSSYRHTPYLDRNERLETDDWKTKFSIWPDELENVYQSLKREEQLLSEIRLLKLQKVMLKNRLESVEHDRESLKLKCQALEIELRRCGRSLSTPALLNARSPVLSRHLNPVDRRISQTSLFGAPLARLGNGPVTNIQLFGQQPQLSYSDRKIYRPYCRPQVTFNMKPDTIHYSPFDDPLDSFDILCQKLKSEINILETQLNHVNRTKSHGTPSPLSTLKRLGLP